MEIQVVKNPMRLGFEHRYRFGMDDELLSRYHQTSSQVPSEAGLLIEVQANFILKPIGGYEEIMESETFATGLRVSDGEYQLCQITTYRLDEYWFSPEESQRIIGEVFSFVKRIAEANTNPHALLIPIVLGIDVCTVQLEGESLDATVDRMIKPDCLLPIKLWGLNTVPSMKPMDIDIYLRLHLLALRKARVRVEDVHVALAWMETCPICLCPPTYGAQLTSLSCNPKHTFHNHCIIQWLIRNKSCPLCRFEIVISRNLSVEGLIIS